MLSSPYSDILAARDAARVNRIAPKLSVPARIRDSGAPSTRAIDARNARLAADLAAANTRDAMLTARGDYCAFTTDPRLFNGGTFRTKR